MKNVKFLNKKKPIFFTLMQGQYVNNIISYAASINALCSKSTKFIMPHSQKEHIISWFDT